MRTESSPSSSTISIAETLIGFDTVSRNSNLGLIEWTRDHLSTLGIGSRLTYDKSRGKANLLATLGHAGPGPAEGGLVLCGHTDVVLLSHAMGAWMANEYLDRAYASTPYTAWVVLGHTGGYSWGMRGYAMPILDVYGEQDYGPTLSSAARRRFALKQSNGSRQVMIAAADQNYTGRERELAAAIDAFLGARR